MLGALDLDRGRPGRALEHLGGAVRRDPSNQGVARAATAAKVMRSPLAWPLLPFERFGAGPTWVAAVLVIFGLRGAGQDTAAGIATVVWLALCAYSWIVGPMLQRRVERGP